VAPPFERFYLGGENDLRGFDIRSVSPVSFLPTTLNIPLTNPDLTQVPLDPKNPRRGTYMIPIPLERIVFPGGDTSLTGNLEYRVTIAGPVALAPFIDLGVNPIIRKSQLTLNGGELNLINQTLYGCPSRDVALNCVGGQSIAFSGILSPVPGTNWVPRMSTGLELQVFLPIINAPFRIYYAYNPLRLDTSATAPVPITRSMFPDTDAGQFTYDQAIRVSAPTYRLREPRKTFRFTVATTF
jgi:outer membrane protein insertion porin family